MNTKEVFCSALFLLFGIALSISPAGATMHNVSSTALTVKLRVSCTEGSSPTVTLNDCFDGTDGLPDLLWWINTVRLPGPANPLVVEIGPGTFELAAGNVLECETGGQIKGFTSIYPGHVSFRGAGSKHTIFSLTTGGVAFVGCQNIRFSDLAFTAPAYGYITWKRGGSSIWTNVEINGKFRLWQETNCAPSRGIHYWFASRLTHVSSTGDGMYKAACDDSWFIGSEIAGTETGGALVDASREIHVYGSVIRVLDSNSATAIYAHNGGEVHIHGTGIDMISTGTGTGAGNFTVLHATDTSRIHADSSAYNLVTGSGGSITRILDQTTSGHGVHAPYLWQGHDDPPSIISSNGADVAVVNDPTGPRFVIYNNACASKWYDVGNNACRP